MCCEFCLSKFCPRPQVKNPRGCEKPGCQYQRQRANEREWRSKQSDYPGKKYYEVNRSQRRKRIQSFLYLLLKCFETGRKLLGVQIQTGDFSEFLEKALFDLGVRRINKFWPEENASDLVGLDEMTMHRFMSTS